MWNPHTYTDTDYGLDEGESFEPETSWEPEPIDTSEPHIMTVLGPIFPEDLGVCHVHEHILADPPAYQETEPAFRLDRTDLASEDLGFYLTAGGTSMVEASTPDYGGNRAGLVSLAQRIPVHIIASAGRQDHQHAALMPAALDQAALEDELRADVAADSKPGVLAFGASRDEVTLVEQVAGAAVANVAAECGYPVSAQVPGGVLAHEVLDLIEAAGFPAARTIVGRLDGSLSDDGLRRLAQRGAWLSFDRIGQENGTRDEDHARQVVRLAEAGFANQLLVSQSLARTSDFLAHGGSPGWVYLIERFTLMLMAVGAEALLVRKLLIDNPARALTITPPDNSGRLAPV